MFAIDLGNGLTLDGEVKAGLKVNTADDSVVFDPDDPDSFTKEEVTAKDDSGDTRASLWNQDAEQVLRTRLTFNYDGELAGAQIRLQSVDVAAAPAVERAYGWANFLGKKVVVYGGRIGGNNDLWGLGKLSINAFDPGLDGITGVRAAFNVVDGLSFGFGLPLDQITYTSYDPVISGEWLDDDGNKPGEDDFDPDEATWTYKSKSDYAKKTANRDLGAIFGGAVFGGLYKAPSGLFGVAATLRLSPAIDSQAYGGNYKELTPGGKKVYQEKASYVEAILGAEVHPIEPLKVVLDAQIDTRKYQYDKDGGYFESDKIGFTLIGLKGEYTVVPALKAYLMFDVLLQNEAAEWGKDDEITQYYDKSKGVKLAVDADSTKSNYVKYRPVEAYGDTAVGFEIGAIYTIGTIAPYLKIGSDNLLWIAGDVSLSKTDFWKKSTYRPGAGVWVKPGATITLGGASIEIFDKIGGIGATDLEYFYKDDNGVDKIGSASAITNQFQVDFNWKF